MEFILFSVEKNNNLSLTNQMLLLRLRYKRALRRIVLVQSAVRRRFARKQLKILRAEAKSVGKQKEINKGKCEKEMWLYKTNPFTGF